MKRRMIVNKLLIVLVAFLLLSSCSDDLLEEKSYDFMGYDKISSSSEINANLWVNGCLNTLNAGYYFMWGTYWTNETQDDDYFTGVSWAVSKIGAGNWLGNTDNTWEGPYVLIHRCDVAIPIVEAMTLANEDFKNNVLGQMYFLKGWAYFSLARRFGAVPIWYNGGINGGEDYQQPREPVMDVYGYAIKMLLKAKELLYDPHNPAYEIGRISKDAASAMLAKVYLTIASSAMPEGTQVDVRGGLSTNVLPVKSPYYKKAVAGIEGIDPKEYFKLARDEAKEVIDNGYFQLLPYDGIWGNENVNSKEHIWSLQAAVTADLWNYVAYNFYGRNDHDEATSGLSGGYYYPTNHWYKLFENQDYRITKGVAHRTYYYGSWFYYPESDSTKVRTRAQVNTDVDDYYNGREIYRTGYPCTARLTKFDQTASPTTDYGDYSWSFIRTAEVFLTFAEAENELNEGPTQDAIDALDAVRGRSNASSYSSNKGVVDFRSAVLEERAKEFALEGIRKWDLIRWGIYLDVMNAIDIDENNLVKRRQEKHLLYPIPASELNSNSSLGQNPGW